jgi:ABC-type nickel/cobalt efflux system permease component RcnA
MSWLRHLLVVVLLAAAPVAVAAPALAQGNGLLQDAPRPGHQPSLVSRVVRQMGLWQRQMNKALSDQARRVKRGEGGLAVAILLALGFGYGVLHALGPGHGKTVVAAYFLDRRRHWSAGLLAGAWVSLGHVVSALAIVLGLTLVFGVAALDVMDNARLVEIASYGLIIAIGASRILAGLTGRLHSHGHGAGGDLHDHGHGHAHSHDHRHEPVGENSSWRRRLRNFFRFDAMFGMLTAAGLVPCSGAMILLLFTLANGILLVGIYATLAIALGMAVTLGGLGLAAAFLRARLPEGSETGWLARGMTIAAGALVCLVAAIMLLAASDRSL